ncbi:hypothetical protein NQ176_g7571 [Zarea fungicola]|uniref:Uncharacterized protein n=1 Tax=Zarea fungicola TaxID=93591 RepID=A0ACC1MY54_9HYPO|nr:hypothetical protein NQ176_g7571 [Lecanicillium fungicola]
MKVSFTLITTLAASLAAAYPQFPGFPGLPGFPPIPSLDKCTIVDAALAASVTALNGALVGFKNPNLQYATQYGGDCFRANVGCGTKGVGPHATPDEIDCSGMVDTALTTAVGALNVGLKAISAIPGAPDYSAGVTAGLACFKTGLGCAAIPPK